MTKGEKISNSLKNYYKTNKPKNYMGLTDKIVNCCDCGKQLSKKAFYYGYKRCLSCSQKLRMKDKTKNPFFGVRRTGKDSPNFKGGKKYSNCIDCGKQITFGCKRCIFCSNKNKWSQERKDKNSKEFSGKGNPNYKTGLYIKRELFCIRCNAKISTPTASLCAHCKSWKGTSDLTRLIRNCVSYNFWRKTCFERDKYTCCFCNQIGGKLEVDHIKRFALILKEFLAVYNQFSPIEDKETLLKLAISYTPFWDINNGRTLCKVCHKEITFNNSRRGLIG